jgi:hypothetical protein
MVTKLEMRSPPQLKQDNVDIHPNIKERT